MSSPKTFVNLCLVVKRHNYQETDRLVTLISQEKGKFTAIAKGVRKLNSSKAAFLEPGNLVKAFFVNTKSMPLLTQAVLIKSSQNLASNLQQIRRLTQILEIFDKLLVEESLDDATFQQILKIRKLVVQANSPIHLIKKELSFLIELLGFGKLKNIDVASVLEYVSSISEQPMKSFDYLNVK